ncbi:MAG: hypothetical protein IJA98_03190 [Bacteroidaceae bacterium]|nr:hypothetical protein [Bacteroidaceae bacterium]
MDKLKILILLVLFALMGQTVQADEKNYLSIVPFYMEPGDVVTVDLNLTNEQVVCAYQTDLVLPEGITVTYEVEDGETYMDVFVDPDRTSSDMRKMHLIDAMLMKDGRVRIVCYSNRNTAFVGNQGAVATLKIKADEGLQAGVYELKLQESEITLKETLTSCLPADFTTVVPVGITQDNVLTLGGEYTDEAVDVLNAALAEKEGIMVVDMKAVTAYQGAVNVVDNPNALIYTSKQLGLTNGSNVVVNGRCENLLLTDGYPFAVTDNFTVTKGRYDRTLAPGRYGTVVLPFAVDEATAASFEFYELQEVGPDYLHFEIVEKPEAGMPYLYINKGDAQPTGFETENSEVGDAVGESAKVGEWRMKATFMPMVITDAAVLDRTYYISSNKIKNATKKLEISAFRAYLEGPSFTETFMSAAKVVGIRLGRSTEIIPLERVEDNVIYDMTGRKVECPGRGLYIMNGKKFYNNKE